MLGKTSDNGEPVNEVSEVQRLKEIADLYVSSGHHRKAAFYKRYAAIKSAQKKSLSDWEECYYLLIDSLDGYKLTLDPIEYEKRIMERQIGWTGIHVQLLCDLTRSSIEMKNEQLAIRHLSFLLQCLSEVLTVKERAEFSRQLELLGTRCGEGGPVNLTLENGSTIPSVNLTKFPLVTMIKIQSLFAPLKPVKLNSPTMDLLSTSHSSPFIFTPIQLGRPFPRRKSLSSSLVQNLAFKWIQGESCQVTIQVSNNLPIELQVNHISLVTDGIPFQTYPTSLTLPAESGPFPIQLTGTPLSSGKLDILGYSTHVLGVKSDCRWQHLPCSAKMELPHKFVIDVIPPLPLIEISAPGLSKSDTFSSIITDSDFIVSNVGVTLYAGQSKSFTVKVKNQSPNNDPIEIISVKLITKLKNDVEKCLIRWDEEEIKKNLPLQAHSSFELNVTVYGVCDFLLSSKQRSSSIHRLKPNLLAGISSPVPPRASSLTGSPHHGPEKSSSKRHQILGSTLANFLADLQVGGGSTNKPKYDILASSNLDEFQSQIVEAIFEFQYSGGDGLAAGYCRKCAIALNVEIMPSVLITRWDVLPAERISHCYLVFDILNSTDFEMELKYHDNKSILIEPRETCRIPVPVERCPLMPEDVEVLNNRLLNLNAILARCKSHLVNQVNLSWSLLTTDISGIASMAEVPWSGDTLGSILMSPVQWDVRVNGLQLHPEDELTYSTNVTIPLSVSITNISSNPLRQLQLLVQSFQDYQNGAKISRKSRKRNVIGSEKVNIDKIPTKEAFFHEVGMQFYFPGVYRVEIQCSIQDEFEKIVINESNTLVWKYSPTIEINVTP